MPSIIFFKQLKKSCGEITTSLDEMLQAAVEAGFTREEDLFALELCARELLVNAVEHGCRGRERGIIHLKLRWEEDNKSLVFYVRDNGPGFFWQGMSFQLDSELQEKGRGLAIVAQLADTMQFNQQGNQIIITLPYGGKK